MTYNILRTNKVGIELSILPKYFHTFHMLKFQVDQNANGKPNFIPHQIFIGFLLTLRHTQPF